MANKHQVMTDFLTAIAPYVVAVGSFGRREERVGSDIDFFLRSRPVNEVDPELGNETYMPEIKQAIDAFGFSDHCSSVLIGHIAVEEAAGIPRMVEISSWYRIPATEPLFVREIYGVKMLCARDSKDAGYESCYDCIDWDEVSQDAVIRYPIPPLEEFTKEKKTEK